MTQGIVSSKNDVLAGEWFDWCNSERLLASSIENVILHRSAGSQLRSRSLITDHSLLLTAGSQHIAIGLEHPPSFFPAQYSPLKKQQEYEYHELVMSD